MPCDTGVVGRGAAELVGPAGAVVGVDVNPAMVAVAERLAPAVDWRVGDAGALALADASVDAWCCQQGLQFVPTDGPCSRKRAECSDRTAA